jgi:hypothetical protein
VRPDIHAASPFFEAQIRVAGDNSPASEALEGERKNVTALFAHLKHRNKRLPELQFAIVALGRFWQQIEQR